MITYHNNKNDISANQLKGFFVGWKKPLTAEQHCKVLYGSAYFIVAVDDETNEAVGYITALSDGVNSAFIPLLEVLPSYQGKGIGTKLMGEILLKLNNIPNIDLICDIELQPFYERFKMLKSTGMVIRKNLE